MAHPRATSTPSPTDRPVLAHATVVGVTGPHVHLDVDGASSVARRAVSCLVAPQLGDRVLVSEADEGSFVLAVLERTGPESVTLQVEGDAALRVGGDLTVEARGAARVAGRDVELSGHEAVRVASPAGTVAIGELRVLGRELWGQVDRVKTVARSVESVSDRFVQRAKRVYQFVEESQHLRAATLEIATSAMFNLRSKVSLLRSSELTKIDGEQIHLG